MTGTDPPYGELATAFAGIARTLFADPTVRGTLQQIVGFAVVTVEGCNAAGIAFLTGTEVTAPVYSDPVALEIGKVRCETGDGPGLDAITSEAIVHARPYFRALPRDGIVCSSPRDSRPHLMCG